MARRRLPAPGEKIIAVLRCEARWRLFLLRQQLVAFRNKLRARAGSESGDPREIKSTARQAADRQLRRLLRRTPWWIDGHLRLGFLAVQSQLEAAQGRDPRSLQQIRIAGEAAERLTAGTPDAEGARGAELRLLLAMELFFRRDFAEAFRTLESLLQAPRAAHLSLSQYHLALEHAAAAALALGEEKRAEALYHKIPQRRRTADTVTAMQYLKSKS